MRVTKNQLEELARKTFEAHRETCHLYVVMRCAYREQDLPKANYDVSVMVYEWPACMMFWENDWWEDQNYIDLWGIYTDKELVEMAMRYNAMISGEEKIADGGESS